MKFRIDIVALTIAAAGLAVATAILADGDPEAGETKAAPCLGCHPAASFAGQDEDAIREAIEAVMQPDSPHPQAGYSEQDMADVAAFYARGGN